MEDLEAKLANSTFDINVVITESVFSMDGDIAPLKQLAELCKSYRGILVVDEAHALGVYGSQGQGLVDHQAHDFSNVITINPCGKGMNSSGAFICGPEWLKNYMINTAREFIFTTAPSPWTAKALLSTIERMPTFEPEREHLKKVSAELRIRLQEQGFNIGRSESQIVPILLGDEEKTLKVEAMLRDYGFLTKAIRPPTVPSGSCRIRLSINSSFDHQTLNKFMDAIGNINNVY